MRLEQIQQTHNALRNTIQPLPDGDISDNIVEQFHIRDRDSVKRKIGRSLGRVLAKGLDSRSRSKLANLNIQLSVDSDIVIFGDRFGDDISRGHLNRLMRRKEVKRVLIPGCYVGGEDVQYWLRHGVKELVGIDVYSLDKRWQTATRSLQDHYGASVCFRRASIEDLPLEDEAFDLVATNAVLEHVRNLDAMVAETARVLDTGGLAWHVIGPLYYCYGADHCIAAYGFPHGYDHILATEEEYQNRIRNQDFFDTTRDPNLPFWALQDQFSFATCSDYLKAFEQRFHIEHAVVKISRRGLRYRDQYPDRWKRMLEGGVAEEDLLIKGLSVVLRKR